MFDYIPPGKLWKYWDWRFDVSIKEKIKNLKNKLFWFIMILILDILFTSMILIVVLFFAQYITACIFMCLFLLFFVNSIASGDMIIVGFCINITFLAVAWKYRKHKEICHDIHLKDFIMKDVYIQESFQLKEILK